MATYNFNGKIYNFPDDVTQDEALQFIDQQEGGSNAPQTPQEAPQQAQVPQATQVQPQPTEAATAPQAQPQSILDTVGDTLAGMGRITAGGVAGLANAGIGAINTIGQGVQSGVNALTGETGQYQPIPAAGYGSLDPYLMPRGTAENLGSDIITLAGGGELIAPLKAAEGAGFLARTGTQLANNAALGLAGSLSKHTSGTESGDVLKEMALNALVGTGLEKTGGAFMRNLPEFLGGLSKEQKAAALANPEFINKVLQNGDESAQQAFRTATTDEAGNTILTPSQVFNTGEGAKYIAAEQRDLTRGANSIYQPRIEAQQGGENLLRAVDESNPALYRGDNPLQSAAQDITKAFKDKSNRLYEESKSGAQQILDNAPVKITNLKMPETKNIALAHLEDNAATGNIKLTPEARKTLKQFSSNDTKINNIHDLDMWKRMLNEKAQKAYKSKDFASYHALNEVKNSLRNEGESVISAIDPTAGSLLHDADRYYADSVGDYGSRSVLGQISDVANPDVASKALLNGENALYNTKQVASAISDAIDNGSIPQAQALARNLAQGLGAESRTTAAKAATTGENFSPTKFINSLNKTAPQVEVLNPYSSINESQVNQALADSIRALRDRSTVPQTNNAIAQVLARGAGGLAGAGMGGTVGGLIGQEVAGRVTGAINKGVLDRLFGTVSRGNKYVDFISDPANAQKIADILNQHNSNLADASRSQVENIIDNLLNNARRGATFSGINNQINGEDYSNPYSNMPQLQPAAAPQPEPEQKAQATKAPDRFADVSPQALNLYEGVKEAETGNEPNPWIRTKSPESGVSTAWGPAQLTGTLAEDYLKNHPEIFTPEELDYLDRFVIQADKFKKAAKNDPKYGYGGTGDLTSEEDKKLYEQVNAKMMDHKYKSTNSLNKAVIGWRGKADDAKYFEKVKKGYIKAKAKRQGWTRQGA
ncbi:hypothetical protein IGV50_004418 [Salmonella enterica subsp. enterica serovar Newport]|nr:hypothetical protein [Salmonella enterica subsp. enterica serovar Newport]